ncbi:hypothetical protein [Candidatus Cyanaurora vandensis]|uniref:hypothetical protein n=1 Tax=Candidatus Cyanaurora vandensis TaxID=2714958 RepID=UPI00257AD329|nr:hypothetical protein [Candidatus Cyanaurora vandensis]
MKQMWYGLLLWGLALSPMAQAQAQASVPPAPLPKTAPAPVVIPAVTPVDQPRQLEATNSILSLPAANQLLQEAQKAAQASDFPLALEKTTQAVTMLNQLSAFHESLAKAMSGIDNRISDEEKQQALTAAIKRDEATYQLALIHRAQGKPELGVPLLVRIVVSQGVDRGLGQKAYQQLYELGFVKTAYPRN